MLTIDFEPPKTGEPCACCGGHTTSLVRFVHSDGEAFAVYFARFSDNHPEKSVSVLVSLGPWWDDDRASERRSFFVRIWVQGEKFEVGVADASESPWGQMEPMGQTLDRAEALTHPWIKDVFHITDHIVVEDRPIIDYLAPAT